MSAMRKALLHIADESRRVLPTACLLLAACGGGGGSTANSFSTDPCRPAGQVQAVLEAMQDRYFWNDQPEQSDKYVGLNSEDFGSADALLDFLRYRPDEFDRFFTYITTIEADNQLFGPGEFVGYGFSFRLDAAAAELWITQVFADSPAEAAGFARGTRIREIDGRTIAEIEAAEGVGAAFGEHAVGVTQQFLLEPLGGTAFSVSVSKAIVTIDAVPQHRVIDVAGRKIGYVEFRSFISTAPAQLQDVFADFSAAGVTDVIVDARYNGGGIVSVADYFASLLAGPKNVSKIASFTRYNQANGFRNSTTTFSAEDNSIDLNSIVFITTENSASATELVINALEPYIDVSLVGERTFGKPVGQSAVDFCTQRLRLVSFEFLNADNEGGFFAGLPVDCPAADNYAFPIGDAFEESLSTALTLITTDACPAAATRPAASLRRAGDSPARRLYRGDSAAREFAYAY